MKRIALVLAFVPALAFSQICPGPGGCIPTEPTGPSELCFREVCVPVTYSQFGANLIIAESTVAGYPVIGWAGPCLKQSLSECPDILNQAFEDLRINALRALRAMDAIRE